jgi:glycosyltransferase involved in cell wall biosynthesis/GT2 family glycosyltransferase
VSLVTARPEPIEGVQQLVLPAVRRSRDWLWRVGAARRALAQLAPDIVHAHYVTSYGYLAARTGRPPLVMTAWGSDLLLTPRHNAPMRWLTAWTLRRATLVTGDSQDLLAASRALAPAVPTQLVHWGVERSRFAPAPWAGKPAAEAVSLRSWEPNYRIDAIVRAFAQVHAQRPDARLHLLGGGSQEGLLRALVADLSLQNSVQIHGRLDDAGMAAVLARCKLSISVPASDATSVSVLESMACGLALLASDLPANREWLPPEALVAAGDEAALAARWLALLQDDALAAALGARNAARIDHDGDRRVQMDAMHAAYLRLLARPAPHPPLPELATPGQARCVSVIAPCRNERAHIDAFCDSVLAQRLPDGWHMQVLVADGDSDDGTRQRLDERAAADARLVPVDNPGRIVSTGLNACLRRARGAVVVRMDIHTRFAPDYLAECMAALAASGADNVGGPWVARGQGAMGRAIAAAFQCRWVVGGARSRDTGYEGEADTVYLGAWPRAVLARTGGFDETLVRNQDDEHNLRLRLAGGRVWQSPRIRSWYVPRGSLAQLARQQFQYGHWRPFVMRKHGQPGSLRQLVPMVFVAACACSALVAPWFCAPLVALLAAYALYLALASAAAARQARDATVLPRLPAVIAAYHLGYGLGSWRGLWDMLWRRSPGEASRGLTR